MKSVFALPYKRRLRLFHVAITASLDHEAILSAVARYKYLPEELEAIRQHIECVQELDRQQEQEHAEQLQASQVLEAARERAEETYHEHAEVARGVFHDNPAFQVELRIVGQQDKALADWLAHRRAFYKNLLENPEALAKMDRRGVTRAQLEDGLALVEAVDAADVRQEIEKAEAQDATEQKNKALAEVDAEMREYLHFARLALKDNPQLMEVLGEVVQTRTF